MKKIVASIAAVAALSLSTGCSALSDNEVSTCTVSDKSATKNSSEDGGGTDYRIYTEDCGTFAVGDSLTRGKWNSSDTYGKIKVGHTYKFNHYGYRNGFLSMFPNITEATEITDEVPQ